MEDIIEAIGINNKTIACQNWTYDTSVYPRTIITDVSKSEISFYQYYLQ